MRVPTGRGIIRISARSFIVAVEHFTSTVHILGQKECCRNRTIVERCVKGCGVVLRTLKRKKLVNEKNITLLISSGRDKNSKGK